MFLRVLQRSLVERDQGHFNRLRQLGFSRFENLESHPHLVQSEIIFRHKSERDLGRRCHLHIDRRAINIDVRRRVLNGPDLIPRGIAVAKILPVPQVEPVRIDPGFLDLEYGRKFDTIFRNRHRLLVLIADLQQGGT